MTNSTAASALFQTDFTGLCHWVNECFCLLTGFRDDEMRGQFWLKVVHQEDRTRIMNLWDEAVARRKPFAAQFRVLSPKGVVRVVELEAVPLGGISRAPEFCVGVMRAAPSEGRPEGGDLRPVDGAPPSSVEGVTQGRHTAELETRLAQKESQLLQLKEELEQAGRAKDLIVETLRKDFEVAQAKFAQELQEASPCEISKGATSAETPSQPDASRIELEKKLSSADGRIAELEAAVRERGAVVSRLEQDKSALGAQLETVAQKVQGLESALQHKSEEIREAHHARGRLAQQLELLRTEGEQASKTQAEKILELTQSAATSQQVLRGEFEHQLEIARGSVVELQRKVAAFEQQCSDARRGELEAKSALDALRAVHAREVAGAAQALKGASEQIGVLTKQIAEHVAVAERFRLQSEATAKELAEYRTRLRDLEDEASFLRGERGGVVEVGTFLRSLSGRLEFLFDQRGVVLKAQLDAVGNARVTAEADSWKELLLEVGQRCADAAGAGAEVRLLARLIPLGGRRGQIELEFLWNGRLSHIDFSGLAKRFLEIRASLVSEEEGSSSCLVRAALPYVTAQSSSGVVEKPHHVTDSCDDREQTPSFGDEVQESPRDELPYFGALRTAVTPALSLPLPETRLRDPIVVEVFEPPARAQSAEEPDVASEQAEELSTPCASPVLALGSEVIGEDAAEVDEQISVLIVEDNAINQRMIVKLLGEFGVRATVVSNGREALSKLQDVAFDLVLMDCQMPVMDGYQAARGLRQMEKRTGKHQRVAGMSAHVDIDTDQRCREAGMDYFLTKPLQREAVRALLHSLFPVLRNAPASATT